MRGVTVQFRLGPAIGAAGTGSSIVSLASRGPAGESAITAEADTQLVATWSRLAEPPETIIGGQSLSASNRQKVAPWLAGDQVGVEAPDAVVTYRYAGAWPFAWANSYAIRS
jgi:hypothetical protein